MTDALTQPKIPVPVIIASDPLPGLWPLSTRERPFVFRRAADGISPVHSILQALSQRPEFPLPILFAPDTAADAVLEELADISPRPRVVFVPATDNPGCIAVLAALMNMGTTHARQLALIPANFRAHNFDAILDGICLMAQRSAETGLPVAFVRPVRARGECVDSDIVLEASGREEKSLLPVGRVLTPARFSSNIEALIEMTAVVRSLGIFLGDGEAILSRAATAHPDAFGACRLALAHADRNGSQTRSRLEFLSLARAVMIDDLIGASSLDLILHPVADTATLVRTLADITPEDAVNAAKSRHVAVEGYSDCRIFASDDGVLVVRHGFEQLAKDHFDNCGAHRRWSAGVRPADSSIRERLTA
jgi:mannose-1-phosphate guanylyltransferase